MLKMNLFTKYRHIDFESKFWLPKWKGGVWGAGVVMVVVVVN